MTTTPRPATTDPVFCEVCEMVEPRLASDPHRCRLCGARCCPALVSAAQAARAAGRRFVPPLPTDATLRAVRQRRRLFYP